jgi:hypothetical protein
MLRSLVRLASPRLVGCIATSLLVLGGFNPLAAAVKLSNLDVPALGATDGAAITSGNYIAQPFRTTAVGPFELSYVTLRMSAGSDGSGQFFVAIYAGEQAPAALAVNGLLSGSANPLTRGDYVYSASGLTLDPDTTYWIVAGVSSGAGSYRWSKAANTSYTVTEWTKVDQLGASSDRGASWLGSPVSDGGLTPTQFSINNASSGAQTFAGADNFDDNDLGTIGVGNRWRFDAELFGAGSTAFGNRNGRLEFTAPANTRSARALGWISPSSSGGAYGFDWIATVDVKNATTPVTGYTLAGLEAYTLYSDASSVISNSAYYGIYVRRVGAATTILAERGVWSATANDYVRSAITSQEIAGTGGYLRLQWTAATRTLVAGFSADGISFSTVRSFALGGADAGLGAPFASGFGLELTGVADARPEVTAGAITFDNMTVSTSFPPAITVQPVGATVDEGQSATLSVGVSGSRPLTYQWFKNDVAVAGATAASLRFATTEAADAGSYKVTVTNSEGAATSAAATLQVTSPLTITSQPRSLVGAATGNATFSVTATAAAGVPITYQWLRNGVLIRGATAPTLTVAASNYGAYSVFVSTSRGTLRSATAGLIPPEYAILTAPVISRQPQGISIPVGSWGVLRVVASGYPPPVYQWRLNGAIIPGAINPTLAISNTQPEDAGSYTVTISSTAGSVVSNAAIVSVTEGFSRQLNISTRGYAGAEFNTLIPAFVISGSNSKRLLIRAAGPALAAFGVGGTLADPQIAVVSNGTQVLTNDNWADDATNAAAVRAAAASVGAFAFADGSKDAAAVVTLPPGSGSILVTGVGGATGEAIVEVYDLDASDATRSRLVNLSTRAFVPATGNPLISGFVVQGAVAKTVLIRATGPTLADFGVSGTLAAPKLTIFDNDGKEIVSNTGWESAGISNAIIAASQSVGAFALSRGSADSAVLTTLAPGNYTAQVTGADGTGGVTLVEVYELP